MGGKSSKVETDPRVGQAAMENAAIGRELAQLGREQFAYSKEMSDRFAPIYEQLLNSSIDESELNAERAADQWDQYKNIFQPIENQMAQEAVNYDSAEEVARREGLAAATVQRQFDASDAQMAREMARMGVSPTSSLGAQGMTDQANARAMARAGAVNKERNDTKLLGMSLRQDAARFGRNQTGTGLAASAAALQGGQAATGIMGAQSAQQNAGAATAGGLMSQGGGMIGSAANTLLNQWNSQQQMQMNAQNQQSAGLGSLVGSLGSAGLMAWAASSKELKEGGRPADDEAALEGLASVPVETWKYKDGVEDGGRHTGPYAEDMQQAFGDQVAPGGVGLDMVSVSGKHHAAIRALDKRTKKMERRLKKMEGVEGGGLADVVNSTPSMLDALPEALRGDAGAGVVGLQDEQNGGE